MFFLRILVKIIFLFFLISFINGNWPKRGEFLEKKISPNKSNTLYVYEFEGNATGGYWTRIYLKGSFFFTDKLIYLRRKPYNQLSFSWIDDDSIKVNDIILDISKNEKYIHPEIQE